MKPKERKNQTQKSRLYCRGNDHRDILYYDETNQKMLYHYGLYWNNDADNQQVDEEHLAWVKFPNKALMFYDYPTFGWIDVDRQFQYATQLGGGQRSGRLFKLNNGIVLLFDVYGGMGTAYCIASDNGVIWKQITSKFSSIPQYQNSFPLGEDSIAWTWGYDYWRTGKEQGGIAWIRVTKDDDGEYQVEQKSYEFDCDTSWLNWYYTGNFVGTINDKWIVEKEVTDRSLNSQQWFFSITRTGHVEMLSDPVPQATWMQYFGSKMSVAQQGIGDGARLFMVTASIMSHDQWSHWASSIVAWMSMDGGATWTKQTLFSGENLSDYDPQHGGNMNRIEMFNRDGEIFILFGQASNKDGTGWHEVHLFSTLTGTSWDEIPLPTWLEMPTIHEYSGRGLSPFANETIKIAIRPNDTSGQDYNMFDLLNPQNYVSNYQLTMDFAHGNILWQDGELKPLEDADFYMVIGSGNLHLYFDNRYMAESSKAFAWYTTSVDSQAFGADYVLPYDYCAPGAVTVETEESNE